MQYDVLVVGAGPAGLAFAERCSPHLRVAVAEEHSTVGEPARCTGVLGLESLKNLGIDYRASTLSYVSSATLHSSSESLNFSFSQPVAVVVDRALFDRKLADMALERGVELLLSTKVVETKRKKDFWEVGVLKNGKREVIKAGVLVLAGGFGSAVRSKLYNWKPRYLLKCYQCEVDVHQEITEVFFTPLAEGFFAWLVPAGNLTRAGLCTRQGNAKRALLEFMKSSGVKGEIVHETGDVIPIGFPGKTYRDGLLVVGEAGGFIKPLTGGGVIFGIISGRLAAETLIKAEDFSEEELKEYEAAWKKSLGREISFGLRAYEVLHSLTPRELDSIFRGVDAEITAELKKHFSFDKHSFLLKIIAKHGMELLRSLGAKRSVQLLAKFAGFY